jgi:hypothetical protein
MAYFYEKIDNFGISNLMELKNAEFNLRVIKFGNKINNQFLSRIKWMRKTFHLIIGNQVSEDTILLVKLN